MKQISVLGTLLSFECFCVHVSLLKKHINCQKYIMVYYWLYFIAIFFMHKMYSNINEKWLLNQDID